MGYTTDFVGHIDVTPALNEAEIAYLSAVHHTRHSDRAEGPYYVPPNPYADDSPPGRGLDDGQPGLWCRWLPCWEGCCLSLDGEEKIYQPERWLSYLIEHFLVPGARAAETGLPYFDDFTFDHRLDGLVVGCRRDTKELFAIRVDQGEVRVEVLRRGEPEYYDLPPLPYEEVIDRDREWTRRRKSPGRRGLRVVD